MELIFILKIFTWFKNKIKVMKLNQKKFEGLKIGDRIPLFTLKDQNGALWKSNERTLGKITVIYFYPVNGGNTSKAQARAFSEIFTTFSLAGIQIVGVNSANVASHKKFAEKNNLPFKILSDTGNIVSMQFGVKKGIFIRGRETFIFDRSGVLIYKFRNLFNGEEHVERTLDFLAVQV
ncbi:peroxiredoxin [Flavobacterium sp. LC2016-01]|uniref:peroxiredoxin n=1 Tax=Flavobacterium sp. LC2016-01 TaxID=2675876 RepID=UPI0012BA95A3|nr:peroxiredoxin [Flavobacterium sp. LC2016-01]MTH17737.1 redoxin domain-containing protein [Flavobacterium sp. LC2016-01]